MIMNKSIFAGRLGQDVQVKDVKGKAVAEFSLAVPRGTAKDSGVDWIKCSAWGQSLCNYLKNYTKKGDELWVEGSHRVNVATDKDGNRKTYEYCLVSSVQRLSAKRTESSGNKPEEEVVDLGLTGEIPEDI